MDERKLLYITSWDFTHPEADGVCKKIIGQIKAFRKAGFYVDYTFIRNGNTYILRDDKEICLGSNHHLSQYGALRLISIYVKKHNDYRNVYIRYSSSDVFFVKIVKTLHENKAVSIVEIPTYPYDNECRSLRDKVVLVIDKLFRMKISNYITSFVAYTDAPKIFGVFEFIRIINGVDMNSIKPITSKKNENDVINLIGVAVFTPSHGYDRLIRSLGEYYINGGKRNIVFHIVGFSHVSNNYNELIEQYNMQKHVIMHGKMYGEELDCLYNHMDIGVCTLALFRNAPGMISSELKSREYAAKGLPMISGGPIDIFLQNPYKYSCVLGDDESLIDINKIVEFYDYVYYENRSAVIAKIRKYAENHCSMDVSVKTIVDLFLSR